MAERVVTATEVRAGDVVVREGENLTVTAVRWDMAHTDDPAAVTFDLTDDTTWTMAPNAYVTIKKGA